MAITVDNDPKAIHDYRDRIYDSIEKLKTQLAKTEAAIETVSASWKDNNFIEFHNNFNVDKEKIKPLCEMLQHYHGLLGQLEEKLIIYLDSPTSLGN